MEKWLLLTPSPSRHKINSGGHISKLHNKSTEHFLCHSNLGATCSINSDSSNGQTGGFTNSYCFLLWQTCQRSIIRTEKCPNMFFRTKWVILLQVKMNSQRHHPRSQTLKCMYWTHSVTSFGINSFERHGHWVLKTHSDKNTHGYMINDSCTNLFNFPNVNLTLMNHGMESWA